MQATGNTVAQQMVADAGRSLMSRLLTSRSNGGYRSLDSPTWMRSKSGGVAPVCRGGVIPRPAAKLGALVVGNGLPDLGLGVHHEWAVLGDGLGDWMALQQQKFSRLRAIF